MRRRSFGERLKKELIGLLISLVFIAIAVWFAIYVLPDMITGMFQDVLNSATE